VLISTLSYCTRFCLCCFLITFYFDKFCYRKNDLDMMISVVTIASEPVSIDYDRSFEKNRDVDVDSMLHGHVD